MSPPVSRRRFLGGIMGTVAGLAAACSTRGARSLDQPTTTSTLLPPTASPADRGTARASDGPGASGPIADRLDAPPDPGLGGDPFTLAVASGDPLPDGVVLWTRLAPDPLADDGAGGMPEADVTLLWEIAEDDAFTRLVATGLVSAAAGHAHSVHVDVTGLSPDRWYSYRFRLGPWVSAAGRTRTAPRTDAAPERLRLAVASCQRWESGYYTPYPHLVADGPDLVVWCGDYIYADGSDPQGPRPVTGGEAATLPAYRNRYAEYRTDPQLRAAYAACPWVVTWDDHEVADNYAGQTPSTTTSANAARAGRGGDFAARRDAAYQAWWEHMPVRLPPPAPGGSPIYRTLRWGTLAQLIVLDGRQYRSDQPCGDGFVRSCAERDVPSATMLGETQEAWLSARLGEAAASGVGWTVLVNQVLMSDLAVPLGDGAVQANMDAWDGYPAARRRLLQAAQAAAAPNLVVLTGDLHCSIVADLQLDGRTVGSEFLGPAISSPFPEALASRLPLAPVLLPQIKLAQGTSRGYLSCDVDRARWRTDYRWVRTVARPESDLLPDGPTFVVDAGTPGARRL